MAWLEEDPRYGTFKIAFRFGGKRYKRALDTKDRNEADRIAARLEENIKLVERGRLELPDDVDLPTFLLSDGKLAQSPRLPEVVMLDNLFKRYRAAHSEIHEGPRLTRLIPTSGISGLLSDLASPSGHSNPRTYKLTSRPGPRTKVDVALG